MPRPALLLALVALGPLALLLGGCGSTSLPVGEPPNQLSTSELRPERFFAGETRGTGLLATRFDRRPDSVVVASTGRMDADGTFRLEQTILQNGRTRQRTWRMQRIGARRYTASLSDAAGPVTATLDGPVLQIRYRLTRWGAVMHQTLVLLPGDSVVDNRATVRFFGLPIARLAERIERVR